jgi:hypothetical protein
MKKFGRFLWLGTGLVLGLAIGAFFVRPGQVALASNTDRFEDYIMCTGPVAISPRAPTDGLWMLDYRKGRLLGTVIDRSVGRIIGWAEMDLVPEFGVQPRQDVHFMMTTGNTAQGQAALYVAEVNSGKLGVYTLQPAVAGKLPFAIYRHDMGLFRDWAGQAPGAQNAMGIPGNAAGGENGPRTRSDLLVPFAGPNKH